MSYVNCGGDGWVCGLMIVCVLQYDEISLTCTAGAVSLCCVCSHIWSVCEFVVVPYVDAITVMRVLLFVLRVWMLRDCEGAAMLVWRWMRCGDCRACGWYTWFKYCV